MGASELAAVLGGGAAVLGAVGGMLRYLLRLAATMERTSDKTASMSEAFQQHVQSSAAFHAALTERVALHDTEIAVLRTRVDTMRP